MITLTGQREIARCNVYRDDVDPLVWYIMPQSPRIAVGDDGKPMFSLVRYRRDVSRLTDEERKTRLGGGILTVSVELTTTDEEMKEIRRAVASDPALHARLAADPVDPSRPPTAAPGPDYRSWWNHEIHRDERELARALKISTVPVVDGTVELAVLAETGAGEFVTTLVGGGGVSMTGRQRASFMAKLTQDGSVLLWEMLERNLAAIRVAYDLKFNHRLDAVKMIVWVEAEKTYTAIQAQWQNLQDNASWSETHTSNSSHYTYSRDQSNNAGNVLSKVAHDSETSRVEIIPEGGGDAITPEQMAELTQIGNDMVKDFLAATFLEWKTGEGFEPDDEPEDLQTELAEQNGKKYGHHGIQNFKLKVWTENMSANLDYQFKSQRVLEGHLRPNDNIGNVLQGHDVSDLRTEVELDDDFFRYMDVTVVSTADFDEDPVDLVKAHLSYQARGPQGDIHSVKDFVFTKGTAPQRFSTYLASRDQLTYDYELEVFYKGSSQTYKAKGKTKQTILVLDTDRLGILRVDLQIGIVDWSRINTVLVDLSYGGGSNRREVQLTLDAQNQSRRWIEVLGTEVNQDYTYKLTFVDKAGQRIEMPAETSRAKTLVVNQPIQEDLEVALVPAGSFGTGGLLSQVVVALRYTDPAHDYVVDDVLTLVKEGDNKTWKVPLIDKSQRSYEYRVTVFYSDGVTREDGWQRTDKTVLPVGDPFGFRLQILPYLLKNPPGVFQFGTIHLAFEDSAANIRAEKDLEITDFTKPLFWRFRLGAPERHTYSYQFSLFKADGTEVKVPETRESKEVLVLVPPAA